MSRIMVAPSKSKDIAKRRQVRKLLDGLCLRTFEARQSIAARNDSIQRAERQAKSPKRVTATSVINFFSALDE